MKKCIASLLCLALISTSPGSLCYAGLRANHNSRHGRLWRLGQVIRGIGIRPSIPSKTSPESSTLRPAGDRRTATGSRDAEIGSEFRLPAAQTSSKPPQAAQELNGIAEQSAIPGNGSEDSPETLKSRSDFDSPRSAAARSDAVESPVETTPGRYGNRYPLSRPAGAGNGDIPSTLEAGLGAESRADLLDAAGTPRRLGLKAQALRAARPLRKVWYQILEMSLGDKKSLEVLKPHRKAMFAVASLLVLDALFTVGLAKLIGPLMNAALEAAKAGIEANWRPLAAISAAIVAGWGSFIFVERKHVLINRLTGLRVARDYRINYIAKQLGFELPFHERNSSGRLANRTRDDINFLGVKNASIPLSVLHYILYLALGTTFMALIAPPLLTAIVFVAGLVLGYRSALYSNEASLINLEIGGAKADLMEKTQEVMAQIRTVKSFASQEREQARFERIAGELRELQRKEARIVTSASRYSVTLTNLATSHIMYLLGGLGLVLAGITPGSVLESTFYAYFIRYGFSGLFGDFMLYKKSKGRAKVVNWHFSRKSKLADAPDAEDPPRLQGHVRFENVSFQYREGEARALDDLSFTLEPGKTVAIVGSSGAGKSTISNLLLGLMRPSSGRILIDGMDSSRFKQDALRQQIAIVPQDTVLFSDTLRYNLKFGAENASDEEVRQAIRMAQADFVFGKQSGLDTVLAEGGTGLSGGERQRIAIARAILKRPPLVIFDEVTSNLDPRAAAKVESVIRDLGSAWGWQPGTVMISHDLRSVRHADEIIVLDQGRAVERGTHGELLSRDGHYRNLWIKGGFDRVSDSSSEPEVPQDAPGATARGQLAAALALGALSAAHAYAAVALGLLGLPLWITAAALALAGAAFAITSVRVMAAVAAQLRDIEASGPRGPGSPLSRLLHALSSPIATPISSSLAFGRLPQRTRVFLEKHEAAHRKHGSSEIVALLSQLPGAFTLAGREVRALWIAGKKLFYQVRVFLLGDDTARPFVAGRLKLPITLETAAAALGLTVSYTLGQLLNIAERAAGSGVIPPALWAFAAAAAAASLALVYIEPKKELVREQLRADVSYEVRSAAHRKVLMREIEFHEKEQSGAIASRLLDDAEAFADKNTVARIPLLKNILMLLGSAVLLWKTSVLISVIIFSVVPLLGVINGLYGQWFEAVYRDFSTRRAALGQEAQSTLSLIWLIKAFGRAREAVSRFALKAQALVDVGAQDARLRANHHILSSSVADLFTRYLPYLAGAWLLALGMGVKFGDLVAMTFYAGFLKAGFDGLTGQWTQFKQNHGATEVLRRWLRWRGPQGLPSLPKAEGAIELRGVSFRYKGQTQSAINSLSFEVRPGETVAIVGESGLGKSTILDLIQALRKPDSGQILIDGRDISLYDPQSVNRQVGVIPQNYTLFNDSLDNNIRYGSDATDEELHAAIRAARAEFVYNTRRFPQGLDYPVAEGGRKLSGGQRQRIAIARALLSKKPILLMDEATSGLDKQTESELQETIETLGERWSGRKPTILMVTHNPSLTTSADRIIVMGRTGIIEMGTHEELMARNGEYTQLWNAAQNRGLSKADNPEGTGQD
ncbi:MAG: ATP-binding cassette domain-containing protein [Elusimicrobia bacterium]|nr:ATP-binding cassette domain-containing protein [Elusimicrobiota bacterium]